MEIMFIAMIWVKQIRLKFQGKFKTLKHCLGDLKDDSLIQGMDGINLDWWQYALIGLGFIVVLMVKALISIPEKSNPKSLFGFVLGGSK